MPSMSDGFSPASSIAFRTAQLPKRPRRPARAAGVGRLADADDRVFVAQVFGGGGIHVIGQRHLFFSFLSSWRAPSPASLRSAPSPAVRERGYECARSKPLSRIAGEGRPSAKRRVGEGLFRHTSSRYAFFAAPLNSAVFSSAEQPAAMRLKAFHITG